MYYRLVLRHHSFPSPSIQTHYVVSVVATLVQFGLEDLAIALEAVNGVHEIWNLLSLKSNFHQPLNRLYLWVRRYKQGALFRDLPLMITRTAP